MRILQKAKKYSVQIIIIVMIVFIQCAFVSQKEGYHMDELLSFELANAEYNPWIVPTQPVGRLAKFMHEEIDGETFGETLGNLKDTVVDVLKNRGNSKLLSYKADVYEEPVWISEEQFEDYVTTGEGDRFNYLSVYFNVKDDNHPPVHFMLLHTISSFFPGKAAPMMGCVINIAVLVGCAILLMKLGASLDSWGITRSGFGKHFGMIAALMYGCSQAGTATVLLIRMYGVLTFLCMLTFYLHLKKWQENSFDKKNVMLIVVTVLGFLTQYFFLFYCLVLAAVAAVCLFVYGRKKELWVYIRSMVIAAVIGVGIYPFAISDVFASSRGVEALGNLAGGLADYLIRIGNFGEILLNRCFGNVWLGLVCLAAVLIMGAWIFWKKKVYRAQLAMFCVPVLGYFLLAAKMSPMYVDRYLMASFPFVIAGLALGLCLAVESIKEKIAEKSAIKSSDALITGSCGRKVNSTQIGGIGLSVIVLLFCSWHVLTYDGTYLYRGYEEQLQAAEEYSELPCICLYEGSGYYDNLLEFAEYEKTLLVTPEELLHRSDASDIEQLQEVIIIVKNIVPDESVQEILDKYELRIDKVLIEDGACGDTVYLCVR